LSEPCGCASGNLRTARHARACRDLVRPISQNLASREGMPVSADATLNRKKLGV